MREPVKPIHMLTSCGVRLDDVILDTCTAGAAAAAAACCKWGPAQPNLTAALDKHHSIHLYIATCNVQPTQLHRVQPDILNLCQVCMYVVKCMVWRGLSRTLSNSCRLLVTQSFDVLAEDRGLNPRKVSMHVQKFIHVHFSFEERYRILRLVCFYCVIS